MLRIWSPPGGSMLGDMESLESGAYLEETGHCKCVFRGFMLFLAPFFPFLLPGHHKLTIFTYHTLAFIFLPPHHRPTVLEQTEHEMKPLKP